MTRVKGVSARTRAAIRRAEAIHFWPDATADALWRYRFPLRRPGRYLDGDPYPSPGIEPEDGRDTLEEILRRLPRGARRDLERIIEPLDREFYRRTVPAPWWPDWAAGRWWQHRVRDY